MKVIYAVCSWGLGHATRSLPVVRRLLSEGNDLTVISNGRSLELLKKELGESVEAYVDIPDYPMLLSENSRQFMAKSMVYWPMFIRRIEKGLARVTKMLRNERYDVIVSDARYDVYSKRVPSFFISHQMRIMNPLRIKMFERGSELFNLFFFKRFAGVIVPDYADEDNLSGELSHNLYRIDESKLYYVGVLSDFKKKNLRKDIDCLVSITGPEPQRSLLEKKLLSQIRGLDGKIVVTLGKTEKKDVVKKGDVEVYSFMTKDEREDVLNRAKLVVSRSGYSTILDLAVIGVKALMIPTPGQIEQEYLGSYHNQRGTFYSVDQEKVDVVRDIEVAKRRTGFTRKVDVDESVEKIMDVIVNVKKSPFQ
ncbi:MAG: glycosyltransferase [Thermoplasmata archaeon]|nr:MAG: glycosyltransferase [Thermoplasmata archaeon]RLF32513.1 MAG: glycosyltransferase [Thermoplasmata archaeon]RLF50266.1 MAG: glycosyltransferase [Thermoplasmata archaeon]